METVFFVTNGEDGLLVYRLDQGNHNARSVAGPFRTADAAWRQAQNLAHQIGNNCEYTALPTWAARSIPLDDGQSGTRACWLVTRG